MASLPRTTFAAGSSIVASEMNTNFNNVENLINDVLDGTQSHSNFTSSGTASLAVVTTTGLATFGGAAIFNSTVTAGTFTGALTGNVTGDVTGALTGNATSATNATNIFLEDESTDPSCYVVFAEHNTSNRPPKTNTSLKFNSATGALTATSFVGALTGNAATATEAATVAIASSANATSQVALINSTSSPQAIKYDGSLDWDGTSNVLKISGNTVWHAGNDGSGSGLNADVLDGIGSGQFLRSDTDDTFTGTRLDLPLGGTSAGNVPLTFGDADSGIYSSGGGTLAITLQGGTTAFTFTTGAFRPIGTDADLGVNIINETWNNVYYEGTLTDVSDERLKTHEEASLGLSFLNRLSPYSGHYIKNPDILFEFMNAQDVRAGLVAEGRDPVRSAMWTEFDDENSTQAIGIDAFIPVLVKAVQELTVRLEALETV